MLNTTTLSRIHEIHEHNLAEQVAYKSGKQSLTYRGFAEHVRRLASLLIAKGIRKGDRVGIYMPRCIESSIAVHGIMRAGCVFVPLDAFSPIERIVALIEDCGIECIIATRTQSASLAAIVERTQSLRLILGVRLSSNTESFDWDHIYSLAPKCPEISVHSDDPAYIIYTSGTTGNPKGIVHTHRSGLAYARLSTELYHIVPGDVVASHAPLHVDMSTFAYLTAPYAGATTVIIPEAYLKLPASLSALMESEKISIWYSVPLALIQLLRNGVLDQRDLSSLRWVMYGGEPFQPSHINQLMAFWPNARFCNVYGPAEVNQCTYYHIPDAPPEGEPIPLGQIWDETSALIMDKDDTEVSNGEIGELFICSSTRMLGYWNRPDLTSLGFYEVRGPNGMEVYYRTGDLVRRNDRGQLMYAGRKDRQVKIKGFRLELDEIETVVNGHPSIAEAAVVAQQHQDHKELVAYVVLQPGIETIAESELQSYLGQRLPPYAIPNTFTFTTTLPRTSAGKLDYSKLGITNE